LNDTTKSGAASFDEGAVTGRPCTIVAGASGVVGLAAARHLASNAGSRVIALSRRRPAYSGDAIHVPLDLADGAACEAFAREQRDATHLVYAAVREAPGLVSGWSDTALIAANGAMFANLLEALCRYAPALGHVTLLQGTKAYGVHVANDVPIPCRESAPRHPHANFYFVQEDALRASAAEHGFAWTILRPQIVFGDALGSNMNPIAAIGAFAALLREAGEPLHYPGGARHVSEATDAELLAEAITWAATSEAARNQVFNVANGDVFVWRDLWPAIADCMGMAMGDDHTMSLADFFADRHDAWTALVTRHGLVAPQALDAFLGQSAIYADMLLGHGRRGPALPQLVSTIKIRQAGFGACVDTELVVCRLLRTLQERRLLPVG